MVVKKGFIQWIGRIETLPSKMKISRKINLKQKTIFPSFIECHTHLVFAGSRADEFEMRNQGLSYIEIAQRGGGILSTVTQTRQASVQQLIKISQARVNEYLRQGVSTVEIKSGYGLDFETEMKMLKVAKGLKGPQVITTFLGAHAKPKEYQSYSDYLNYILDQVLPYLKSNKLTRRVDIFIEKGFFDVQDSKEYLQKFKDQGFDVTIHANQLTNTQATDLAVELGAKSADHVICLSEKTIRKLAHSKTVAVLLPTADLYMKCDYPPARKIIDQGGTVALATDFNPGSCPSQDIMLVGLLARLKMGMKLSEVFQAYTLNAAKALGIEQQEGSLEVGKKANFICTESSLSDFFYSAGCVPRHDLYILGSKVKRM